MGASGHAARATSAGTQSNFVLNLRGGAWRAKIPLATSAAAIAAVENHPPARRRRTLGPWRLIPSSLAVLALGGVALSAAQMDSADCLARLDAVVEAISSHPRVKDQPREKIRATTEFALGNILFAFLHELGHGLIVDLGLPVLGREEDAADAFAVVAMLEMRTEFTHRTLVNTARSWMISDRRRRDSGDPVVYYDAHGLDLQRAYNIICLMVGSDPERFDDLAKETNLPEDRRETCVGDYSNASWSWNKALEPYRRTANQKQAEHQVIYGKPQGDLDIFERALRAAKIMELVADLAATKYAWPKPFAIEARTCGEPGASWSVPEHKIIFCYELADEFVQLYKLHGEDPLPSLSPLAGTRSGKPLGYR
jgi:hypothetical protein